MSRKSKFHYKRARKTDTSHGDQCQYTFFIPSRSVLLRMRNVSEKSCRENQNTHFMYYAFFFRKSCFYEIMWKNIIELDKPQMTIWGMCIACWLPKATNTHSYNVILITFPLQQWLHKQASVLHYVYFACLFVYSRCPQEHN